MKIIGVIPARYASTRFPGKPLVDLAGKPLLQWVVEGARKSQKLAGLYVATDDERIAQLCQKISVNYVMTESSCPTGTDRIFAATQGLDFDVVLNIQGDEPLTGPQVIDPMVRAFEVDPTLDMATLAHPLSVEDVENRNAVKVILNSKSEAIYFSRFAIPYSRESEAQPKVALKHIGLYAYSKKFLTTFCSAPQSELEKFESLEQLRALYLGARIKVLRVEQPTYGVDSPADIVKVEQMLLKSK